MVPFIPNAENIIICFVCLFFIVKLYANLTCTWYALWPSHHALCNCSLFRRKFSLGFICRKGMAEFLYASVLDLFTLSHNTLAPSLDRAAKHPNWIFKKKLFTLSDRWFQRKKKSWKINGSTWNYFYWNRKFILYHIYIFSFKHWHSVWSIYSMQTANITFPSWWTLV